MLHRIKTKLEGGQSVQEVVTQLSSKYPDLSREEEGVRLRLIAFKQEQVLQLWAEEEQGEWVLRSTYPFTGFSGTLGPKLREGDRQIPEGIYRVLSLNPNSRFHLSIELDYPNAFDRRMAQRDGRENPGGEIFIHGGSATVGCIPIGDPAIEQLFLQLALSGFEQVEVIMAPTDLRHQPEPGLTDSPEWLDEKYQRIRARLAEMPERPLM